MHIGKTAGTSFFYLLRETLTNLAFYHASPEEFDKVTAEDLRKYDLITGHFSFVHTEKFRPDRYLAVFLRDPVERVISNYYFLHGWDGLIDDSNRIMVQKAKMLSLSEFLESDEQQIRMVSENHQAYFLTTDYRALRELPDDELLDQALHNLRTKFNFIGLTEYYEESVALFFDDIGLPPVQNSLRRTMNVTPDRISSIELGEDERNLIRQLNAVDIEIYEAANEIFMEQRERLNLNKSYRS